MEKFRPISSYQHQQQFLIQPFTATHKAFKIKMVILISELKKKYILAVGNFSQLSVGCPSGGYNNSGGAGCTTTLSTRCGGSEVSCRFQKEMLWWILLERTKRGLESTFWKLRYIGQRPRFLDRRIEKPQASDNWGNRLLIRSHTYRGWRMSSCWAAGNCSFDLPINQNVLQRNQ